VALMNEFQPPVTTCSIGFEVESYDEAKDAKSFAGKLGANHFGEIVKPHALDLVPKLAWHYDEPFADSSAVPTYYVSEVARRHVTVALSGDGGDENFAGYRRYKLAMGEQRLRSFAPLWARRPVFGALGRVYPKMDWAPRIFRAKSTFQSLGYEALEGYFHGTTSSPALKRQILSADVSKSLEGYDPIDVLQAYYDRADTEDPLSRLQYVDMKTYLVDDILVKVDRASMANSLEVRCPLLDHKLMELIARIPSNLKLHRGQGKYIFKKALGRVLPPEILERRKKGFAVPVAEWFRGELKESGYQAILGRKDNLLNHAVLKKCWDQHQRGLRDWSVVLWAILMFRTWQEVHKTA